MKHSKKDNLYYTNIETQEHLKIPGIQAKKVLNWFKWRVRMPPLGENFRGNEENKVCSLCSNHLDNQNMIFQCEQFRQKIDIN